MSEEKQTAKRGRPSRTVEEEIAVMEQKLSQLRAKKREEEKRKLEQNQKSIMALLRSADLDSVESGKWEAILPKVKKLLESAEATGEAKAEAQAA